MDKILRNLCVNDEGKREMEKKWVRGKYVEDGESAHSHIHVHAQGLSMAQERRQLWRDICVNVAGAANTRTCDVATSWANTCLKAFDEKFTK